MTLKAPFFACMDMELNDEGFIPFENNGAKLNSVLGSGGRVVPGVVGIT